jgi:23S rRNA (cytidine1920-2'-O)/16S rRNA (cytidine1409-2'-O)-methyltransferase
MDIGAATGGFTDVCLRQGAAHVYAIDVGYGQLDWKLRNDPRVTVMERTNARYLTPEMFAERPEIAVMDVSFISIRLIIPAAFSIMGDTGRMYTLIKPQFEAGREKVGKKGVVRDPAVHLEVIRSVISFAKSISLIPAALSYSPIRGPEGNIEYLLWMKKKADAGAEADLMEEAAAVVAEAHRALEE